MFVEISVRPAYLPPLAPANDRHVLPSWRVRVVEIARGCAPFPALGEVARRRLAIYLARVGLELPVARIARGFGVSASTVTRDVAKVEDGRDDDSFDHAVERALARLGDGR